MAKRNIVGQVAAGEDFFERPGEVKKLWNSIRLGANILISAPRRVGKTSLMYYLLDNPEEGYVFLYVITQSVNSSEEFYNKILKGLLDTNNVASTTKYSHRAKEILSGINIKSLGLGGLGKVELETQKKKDNEKRKLEIILEKLDLKGQKLIIMIDEITETVENIKKKEGEENAVAFLQELRELLLNRSISKKVQFILTGSIGLENIVNLLKADSLINHLRPHKVKPLSEKDALRFIGELVENQSFTINEARKKYLLKKIEWLIPFYVQLFISEIINLSFDTTFEDVTKAIIDSAFKEMLGNRNIFDHWNSRLKKSLSKENYKFALSFLNLMSQKGVVTSGELYNLAAKNKKEETFKEVVNILLYDGYINNNENHEIYRFNSPILKEWWNKNVTN